MPLTELTVPKMKSEEGDGGSAELSFRTAEETVKENLSRFAGKVLLLSDATAYARFAPFGRNPRVFSFVAEEDALPLFTVPEAVSAVFAAGGENTLKSARFFAEVRRVPAVLFPSSSVLRGAFERAGDVTVDGKAVFSPLAEAEIYCDEALLAPSLAEGFAALLLSRLALLENRALNAFFGTELSPRYGEAKNLLADLAESPAQIVRANARMRLLEVAGAPVGEGETLARLYGRESFPRWRAFSSLSALYCSFFKRGKPRRYVVPRYAERAERAGVKYCDLVLPTAEEYALRALALERTRASLLREAGEILARKQTYLRIFRTFAGKVPPRGDAETMRMLPERCPNGLSSVLRDFGLLEGK